MKAAMTFVVCQSQLKISKCHRFAYKKYVQPLTGSAALVYLGPVPRYA